MKLPSQKKILREDLKGAPEWVGPMTDVLNSFMETIYQAMNKNITIRENIAAFTKELTYKTPSTYPVGVENVQFASELKSKATGVILMQVYDKATYLPAAGPIYVPWVEINGNITIFPISGLEADKNYLVRLLIV